MPCAGSATKGSIFENRLLTSRNSAGTYSLFQNIKKEGKRDGDRQRSTQKKAMKAASAEEAAELVKADGWEITPEDAGHLWEEITRRRGQDGKELSPDELEAVSGGADRNWVTDGCAATVEYGSHCGSNDKCIVWDVTYDFQPTGHLCPNCGKNMYKQNTICQSAVAAPERAGAFESLGHRRYALLPSCDPARYPACRI